MEYYIIKLLIKLSKAAKKFRKIMGPAPKETQW